MGFLHDVVRNHIIIHKVTFLRFRSSVLKITGILFTVIEIQHTFYLIFF